MNPIRTHLAAASETLPWRTRHRAEMNGQIVHDSIHRREGWARCYLLEQSGAIAGFGSVAIAGPWQGKPTVFEFYLLPEHRTRAFDLFEAFLDASKARFLEVQSNDPVLSVMLHAYGRDIVSEKIVFHDALATALVSPGASLKPKNSTEEILACLERRQGGGEWLLEAEGKTAGHGGILFHYNRPYADLHMEIEEPFRRCGLGSYFVQELKRLCYELGAIPCARCSPENLASRRTLQRAGFVPHAHILCGSVKPSPRLDENRPPHPGQPGPS